MGFLLSCVLQRRTQADTHARRDSHAPSRAAQPRCVRRRRRCRPSRGELLPGCRPFGLASVWFYLGDGSGSGRAGAGHGGGVKSPSPLRHVAPRGWHRAGQSSLSVCAGFPGRAKRRCHGEGLLVAGAHPAAAARRPRRALCLAHERARHGAHAQAVPPPAATLLGGLESEGWSPPW